MYDIGKAFIMTAQILMFIFAASTSIYLYSNVNNHLDGVMLSNDYSNRGDSIVGVNEEDATRKVSRAEIISKIMSLKDNEDLTIKLSGNVITHENGEYFNLNIVKYYDSNKDDMQHFLSELLKNIKYDYKYSLSFSDNIITYKRIIE